MTEKWYDVYKNIADALEIFYSIHGKKSGADLFKLCESDSRFVVSNTWIGRVKEGRKPYSIDPIQIFASFNDPKAANMLRLERINALLSILQHTEIESIDFLGCPTLITINVMARRNKIAQNQIWQLFHDAWYDKKEALTPEIFEQMGEWYGINIPSLTVFLFWIDANSFLPLDRNTVQWLRDRNFITTRPKHFDQYLDLLNDQQIQNYPQISVEAVGNRRLEAQPIKVPITKKVSAKEIIKQTEESKEKPKNTRQQIEGCRILAVRVYKSTPEKWRKVLVPGKIYSFYSAFEFKEKYSTFKFPNDATITYDYFKDTPFYHTNNLQIHISAIVGENGSGKSTLTELIFLAINNYVRLNNKIANTLKVVDDIYLDLYFITDALYRLSIQGRQYVLVKYSRVENAFNKPEIVEASTMDFEQFFYTVAINYALYALNSAQLGPWVTELFHKNDQYQVPIVISPFRKQGVVNINGENKLVRTRLMANMLLPVDSADNIRKLTKDRYAKKLKLTLDLEKFYLLYKEEDKEVKYKEAGNYWNDVISEVAKTFKIKLAYPQTIPESPKTYVEAAWMYLLKKIISICITYPGFQVYFNSNANRFNKNLLAELVTKLQGTTSHVTHKLYQTIHFLKYNHLAKVKNAKELSEITYDIQALSKIIVKQVEAMKDNRFKSIHFNPPAFLNPDIILDGNVNFADLSSGEKQRIYSVSSVAYHIVNIDSNINERDLIAYPSVNILFDEVELYFHPEMQRTFIKYMLDYLRRIELESVNSLNIIFVTHSPFILSDIPTENILFLHGDKTPEIECFAGNIHYLLANSFFLENGFMGEYAKDIVQSLIKYLSGEKANDFGWDKDISYQIIDKIGEKLLKQRLSGLFFERFGPKAKIGERIAKLEEEIKRLQNEKDND